MQEEKIVKTSRTPSIPKIRQCLFIKTMNNECQLSIINIQLLHYYFFEILNGN